MFAGLPHQKSHLSSKNLIFVKRIAKERPPFFSLSTRLESVEQFYTFFHSWTGYVSYIKADLIASIIYYYATVVPTKHSYEIGILPSLEIQQLSLRGKKKKEIIYTRSRYRLHILMSIILRKKCISQYNSYILILKSLPMWDWDSKTALRNPSYGVHLKHYSNIS